MSRPVAVDLGTASVRCAVQFGTRTVFLAVEPRRPDTGAHITRALEAARSLGPRGEAGTDVVITIPGNLDPAARAALRSEVEAAGAVLRHTLGHAAASAIAHAATRTGPQRLLVVDIGDRSAEVAVVDTDRDVVEMRAGAGDDMEHLSSDLFDRWDRLVTQVLLEAGAMPAEFDEVLVVGAADRTPWIGEMLERHMGRRGAVTLAGPELPAAGAAVLAEALAGHRPVPTVFETLGMGIYLVHAGAVLPVLPYGAPLPARRSVDVPLGTAPASTELRAVRPARRGMPHTCRLADVILPTGPGTARVRVDVDAGGLANVHVSMEGTDGGE